MAFAEPGANLPRPVFLLIVTFCVFFVSETVLLFLSLLACNCNESFKCTCTGIYKTNINASLVLSIYISFACCLNWDIEKHCSFRIFVYVQYLVNSNRKQNGGLRKIV